MFNRQWWWEADTRPHTPRVVRDSGDTAPRGALRADHDEVLQVLALDPVADVDAHQRDRDGAEEEPETTANRIVKVAVRIEALRHVLERPQIAFGPGADTISIARGQ